MGDGDYGAFQTGTNRETSDTAICCQRIYRPVPNPTPASNWYPSLGERRRCGAAKEDVSVPWD